MPTPTHPAADEIAKRILHEESAHGERIVAWGRGIIWGTIGLVIASGASQLEVFFGRAATVALGAGLTAAGTISLVYAARLRANTWDPVYGLVTVAADIGMMSMLPVGLAFGGDPMFVTGELLGASPLVLLLTFGLAAVALRQDPRATALATAWVVALCLFGAVAAAGHRPVEPLPATLRSQLTPAAWCVRALLMGLTGCVLVVAGRKTRVMVYRTSGAMAERTHVMRVFGRFVAPEIRDAVVHDESPAELRMVTVLFTDLRDFTALAERSQPTELMSLLNRHFALLVPVVHRHGGTVNKFVGDALMATFGAPVPLTGHAAAAVRAAIDMVAAMAQLNAELRAEGRAELRIGVGIATGPVVVGNLGDPERAEYAVLGDTVNVAARLEGLNKERATQILVTEATAMDVGEAVPLRELERARIRGKEGELRVFTPA